MKLADVIEKAINEHLSKDGRSTYRLSRHSCVAVLAAQGWPECLWSETLASHQFLKELGCDTESIGLFNHIPIGQKRQMARALWLTWAAMIAREEGVEI